MKTQYEIIGYHKELYDVHTGKYIGHVNMTHPDRAKNKFGWFGRVTMHVKGTAVRNSKEFDVDGEYITECIPVCGRIIGDAHRELQKAHEWRNVIKR